MPPQPPVDPEDPWYLSPEDGWKVFDEESRRILRISGEEFLRRWDAGELRDTLDTEEGLMSVAMLLPLVRDDVPIP